MSSLLTLAGSSFLFAAAMTPTAAPSLDVSLRPLSTSEGDIQRLDILIAFEPSANGSSDARNMPLVQIPLVTNNVDTVANTLSELNASDRKGALTLVSRDTADGIRQWFAHRPAEGRVTLRYLVPAQSQLAPRGAAPPLELQTEDGGVSGNGGSFLLLPPGDAPYRLSVNWDLSSLPEGARGLSSLGSGNVTLQEAVPATWLTRSFFMAGRIGAYPEPMPKTGFFAGWQGKAPFDVPSLMAWTEKLYGNYAQLFGQKVPPPYGVFLRRNRVNPGGGVGQEHSFVATYDEHKGNDPEELKLTLAHEMFHTFQPRIEAPGLEGSWFSEGMAVHYQRALPFRYGLIDADAFLADLNFHAGRYYTSIKANVPNSEVTALFWQDTRVRTLPYDRGSLYMAALDEQMRAKSGGERSLDDLMLAMHKRQESGVTLKLADWEELLRQELGENGVKSLHAMLAGATPLPGSAAFGPCFRRVTKKLRRFELGFDPTVLTEPKRIVRGLVAGSSAAAAGLKDGDEILKPVGQDNLQGQQEGVLTLNIRRDGRDFEISYKPRGELVDAYQWERAPGVTEDQCRR